MATTIAHVEWKQEQQRSASVRFVRAQIVDAFPSEGVGAAAAVAVDAAMDAKSRNVVSFMLERCVGKGWSLTSNAGRDDMIVSNK